MTKEEIIDMAREAGFFAKENEVYSPSNQEDHELTPYLKNFAKLIAEKEREECAKVCDAYDNGRYSNAADLCAESIRARGQE